MIVEMLSLKMALRALAQDPTPREELVVQERLTSRFDRNRRNLNRWRERYYRDPLADAEPHA